MAKRRQRREPSRADLLAAKDELWERLFGRVTRAYARSSRTARRGSATALADTPLNVLGVSIGRKETDGSDLPDAAIRVLVRKKLPTSETPRAYKVVRSLGGIPTDVVECGLIRAHPTPCQIPTARLPRPFAAGVSVSGHGVGAGSLGYRVRRPGSSKHYVLSNFHVLAKIAGEMRQEWIYQPGLGDADLEPRNRVGIYVTGVPLKLGGVEENVMDAAVARVPVGTVEKRLCRLGPVAGVGNSPQEDDPVWMFGKVTKGVNGDVDSRGAVADVIVRYPGNHVALFVKQLRIQPRTQRRFGRRGDSGSLLINTRSKKAVGLYFAGDARGAGYATPLKRVLGKLKVELA